MCFSWHTKKHRRVSLSGVFLYAMKNTKPLRLAIKMCIRDRCTVVYDPTSEGGIPYDDPTVNVQWPACGCEHKMCIRDSIGTVKLVQCNFSQYSSRYDAFCAGDVQPAFDPACAGGALMDLGVYLSLIHI